MCGIAGIIAWDQGHGATRELLARMSGAIAHRGPDADAIHIGEPARPGAAQVALAHRRLAVIDLDARANQPFTDARGRWIVYNGEIYNYVELRRELQGLLPDYAFRTSSDTEVLLAAYAAWGEACVDRLNGMFAFAVWDQPEQRLLLARDRMGQKPLYYALAPDNAAVAFASELAALREVPWAQQALEPTALHEYLLFGYIAPPRTIYRGIGKLPPATRMTVTAGGVRGARYFDPNAPAVSSAPVEPGRARELVIQAVRRQLVADVPLGCLLSGGIDSSVVAAAMRAVLPREQRVLSFTVGFDDPLYDETSYAAAVARHLGTEHQSFIVRPNAVDDLPKLARVFGEPFGDSSALPTHYLARETRRRVKVALSGDGGDELFGGYERYRAMAIAQRVGRLGDRMVRFAGSPLWQRLPGRHPKSRLARLKRFLGSLQLPTERRYASYMHIFSPSQLGLLLLDPPEAHALWMLGPVAPAFAAEPLGDRGPVERALAVDRLTYLPEDLLTKVDRASMLHALEVRSPFMDHELVHFAASLPTAQLIRGGPKRMLREAFARELPAFVFQRRKMGFAVPIGDWFRTSLRAMLRDHLLSAGSFASAHFQKPAVQRLISEHEQYHTDHAQRLYALLMLELWHRGA